MNGEFFEHPILNSPYEHPARHWELDRTGQPTSRTIDGRRRADFATPIPKPKTHCKGRTEARDHDHTSMINRVRGEVHRWRSRPSSSKWQVTPETARLLQHWRHHKFSGPRPFFCQLEAVETVIWLTEVAPKSGKKGHEILADLSAVNDPLNSQLARLALKLATGAGKTTVMAMLIAWQTINAARRPNDPEFTLGFLIIAPGLTIKDRLRVLLPNDPDSYYQSRELVPTDMLADLNRAKIVITNYHAFKRRDMLTLSKGGRSLLQGRGPRIQTQETDGQMLQRVMPSLMGMTNILAVNDEGHHCYRPKPGKSIEGDLTGDNKREAEKNREAAHLWISGLEVVQQKLGLQHVIDLSATPFFLRGSGYAEGTLFPWTMSDFSLMDAIECGIVKLPRVPIVDNIPGGDCSKHRNLWEHIGKKMPKKGRSKAADLDPFPIPAELQAALEALYVHYRKTFFLWEKAKIDVPPCFIVVCNNTSTSKLVYEYISGFHRTRDDETATRSNGRLPLFRNFDDDGNPIARPRTVLIDSQQLESGEALDPRFRRMAAGEIDRFRRENFQRTGDRRQSENITDSDLLREVTNTVGKKGRLGESIRCVVSVSMLTEGWDANTVTHILGIRALGTQLLCEQVVGRALRRQSYELNDEGLFNVEYADVLGIPFDFLAKPVVAQLQPPRETIRIQAITPDRDGCEIRFPRVQGYRIVLPEERLSAVFNDNSTLELTPTLVRASVTRNQEFALDRANLQLAHPGDLRRSSLLFHLTKHLLYTKWRDPEGEPKLYLFDQLKRITRQWLDKHLVCREGTVPVQVMIEAIADMACERIAAAIAADHPDERPIRAVLDPYNPTGSTRNVRFNSAKMTRWKTSASRCHINWIECDCHREIEFCRVAEAHPRVRAYVKNQNLGLEVPYRSGSEAGKYIPDFVLLTDDGRRSENDKEDLLYLVVDIKGYQHEDAKAKKATMEANWIPSVNHLGTYGRWGFAELTPTNDVEAGYEGNLVANFNEMLEHVMEVSHEKG